MRLLAIIACLILACGAGAQDETNAGIVEHWGLGTSGTMDPMGATFWVDFSQTVAATITANTGQTLTRHGAPVRVNDGTWWRAGLSGSQGYAETFDGAADYWTSTIAPPAESFSVVAIVTPTTVDASDDIVASQWKAGGGFGWYIERNGTGANFYVSDDGTWAGGHASSVTKAGCFAMGRRTVIAATYQYVADGTSVGYLYCDGLAAATNATMDGPVYSGADTTVIGASAGGLYLWTGAENDVRIWTGSVLTAAQVAQLRAQWLGLVSSGGNAATVTSATPPAVEVAPPASGTEPFLVDMPANTTTVGSPATGAGGVYAAGAVTNLAQRASFETWAAGSPTGWTEANTAGDGTADWTQGTGKAHGASSALLTLTGTTSASTLTGACLTSGQGADLWVSVFGKKTSGTAHCWLRLKQFSAADCLSGALADIDVYASADVATSWTRYGAKVAAATWAGTTAGYQIQIDCTAGAVVVAFDGLSAVASAYDSDSRCFTDADASAVCTAVVVTAPNPISPGGNFTLRETVRTSWAGSSVVNAGIIGWLGTSAAHNRLDVYKEGDANWYFDCYDSAGAMTEIGHTSTWTANADHVLDEFYTQDLFGFRIDGGAWTTGTGCHRAGTPTTMNLGDSGGRGYTLNGWIRDVILYRRWVQ